jgi:hypothetical protein
MNSQITEFSYGFALTHELINNNALLLGATAPEFPSLSQEGAPGGGYDVALDFGTFLFLQFKLSEYMIRNTAGEAATLGVPYYRFWIMPPSESQQHPMLLELEQTGGLVYYAAPVFWTQDEFNNAFTHHLIAPGSLFVPPNSIGVIQGAMWHPVAFNENNAYIFSEPKKIRAFRGQDVVASLLERRKKKELQTTVQQMAISMNNIARSRRFGTPDPPVASGVRPYLSYISFLSHAVFGAEAVFIPALAGTTA